MGVLGLTWVRNLVIRDMRKKYNVDPFPLRFFIKITLSQLDFLQLCTVKPLAGIVFRSYRTGAGVLLVLIPSVGSGKNSVASRASENSVAAA